MPVIFENTPAFAKAQDAADPSRAFRDEFPFPQHPGSGTGQAGKPVIYFTGNSLGLQPKAAAEALVARLTGADVREVTVIPTRLVPGETA